MSQQSQGFPGRGSFLGLAKDLIAASKLTFQLSRLSIIRAWGYVPFGIVLMLLACFGVDVLLKHIHVSFPASVACLILLFFGLLLSEATLGTYKTKVMANYIDVPAGWSLRWISVFFMPTFVLLPLSPPIGVVEVFKIIAVFVLGFIVMMVFTAYMTRILQLLKGTSKRAYVERAEELGTSPNEDETEIPISRPISRPEPPQLNSQSQPESSVPSRIASNIALDTLKAPPPFHASSSDFNNLSQTSQDPILPDPFSNPTSIVMRSSFYRQIPIPPPRSQRWASYLAANRDFFIYGKIALFIGIPVYYATDYAMPIHACITILAYYTALTLPPSWKRFLHPVLVSALITVLSIWILGLTRHLTLRDTLHQYRTGVTYLQLWDQPRSFLRPGAADLFGTILDASIVSLALPMYTYRRELKAHFTAIIIPNIVLSIGSLFAYPILCFTIGISAERSLAFAARSLTLALAKPAMDNLGGDVNTVSGVAIMSGIIGALVGGRMLDWMRIPEDDYVTRGVTLGANSSAIATALLLQSDPRAAALSILSMSLFGTITVLFTAVPAIRDMVRSMVGL